MASLAAGCFIAVALTLGTSTAWSPELTALPARGLVAGILVAVSAALPSAAIIYRAEVEGRRAARFYASAGAVTGGATCLAWALLLSGLSPQGWQWPNAQGAAVLAIIIAVCAGAGLLAGLTYWAIAGRDAGSPAQTRRIEPPPPAETHSPSTAA